jgi:hypothetical protein
LCPSVANHSFLKGLKIYFLQKIDFQPRRHKATKEKCFAFFPLNALVPLWLDNFISEAEKNISCHYPFSCGETE